MITPRSTLTVAIACGGTGGHLFPGLAVAEELRARDGAVTLLVSPKDVDQRAVNGIEGMTVVTLPAVAFQSGSRLGFFRGSMRAYRALRAAWKCRCGCETAVQSNRPGRCDCQCAAGPAPHAALGMGGFTSVAPLLAARRCGAATFLHDSNAIPGRANRLLSWLVDQTFVGFPAAAKRLHGRAAIVTGTPVRPQFETGSDATQLQATRRLTLGLHPDRPVVLVVGGSQGARGLNDAVLAALPLLARQSPETQWIHLTGPQDVEKVRAAYVAARLPAIVLPFFDAMDVAMGAASMCISRAGASFLAELAAMRVPAVLVPLPTAADNHQWHNAQSFSTSGAARLLAQSEAAPEVLTRQVCELLTDDDVAMRVRVALARWHTPRAAADVAEAIVRTVAERQPGLVSSPSRVAKCAPDTHATVTA
jgi:UDP-N-acetylglucosamine--N-acetylmuramyl-(pentapeptide) pyrophosphoryl-undecaprenol N-acetylglucosamine transferase